MIAFKVSDKCIFLIDRSDGIIYSTNNKAFLFLQNKIKKMNFLSLEPFVPSGSNFEASKQLFQALGFMIKWDAGDYIGFERGQCNFILQRYDNVAFAENLMINVRITNVELFRNEIVDKKLPEIFGIRIGNITLQPYGKEVNLIDIAGVCWHFVES